MTEKKIDLSAILQKKSILLILAAAGLLLLLLPRQGGSGAAEKEKDVSTAEEKRLCAVLSKIEGVGETHVLLSEEPNRRGAYTGAVIVCAGARSPDVRLRIISAVAAFTGLGSNRIIVEELIS